MSHMDLKRVLALSSVDVGPHPFRISQFRDCPYCQVTKVAPDIDSMWKGSMHCLAWLMFLESRLQASASKNIQKQRCQKKTWNKPTQGQQHLFHLLLIVGVLCLNKFTVAICCTGDSNAPGTTVQSQVPTVSGVPGCSCISLH